MSHSQRSTTKQPAPLVSRRVVSVAVPLAARPAEPSHEPRTEPSDQDLILQVRNGDRDAFLELYDRHHGAALRLARHLGRNDRAEDVAAEAFTKILDLLSRGKGPDYAFRAYLLATVRTVYLNWIRDHRRESPMSDQLIEAYAPIHHDQYGDLGDTEIGQALRQLPERWQRALWLTTIEGLSPDEASDLLGLRTNALRSLTFRARAGLRRAYLSGLDPQDLPAGSTAGTWAS